MVLKKKDDQSTLVVEETNSNPISRRNLSVFHQLQIRALHTWVQNDSNSLFSGSTTLGVNISFKGHLYAGTSKIVNLILCPEKFFCDIKDVNLP